MFSPEVESIIPDWKAKKDVQWEAVKDSLHGLQLAVSGDRGTQYMLICSPHDGSFYEGIVFGQLPQVVLEEYGSRLNRRFRDQPDDKKPYDKRTIDLSDEQIAQVVEAWRNGQSALTLPFITSIVNASGKTVLRQ